ncbi:MAG: hypothetical protein HJJLKODD_00599 [Phycisphaerae bacterium]|nr:hypothetical protein [Phycisphaerae bacterium]
MNRSYLRCYLLSISVLVVVWGCGPTGGNDNVIDNSNDNIVDNNNDNVVDNTNDNTVPGPADTFPTSLHYLRTGKTTFYSAENDGFETFTGIPMSELNCLKCHPSDNLLADDVTPVSDPYEPTCADCHVGTPGETPVAQATCLGCHSRENVVINALQIPDVHRTAGMECADCHSLREMHGDGTEYASMFEPGAMDTRCENCHKNGENPSAPQIEEGHDGHSGKIDCASCHMQTSITCFSCHFPSEEAGNKRFFSPPRSGFVMLLNRDRGDEGMKVHPAGYQSLTYNVEGQSDDQRTFVGFGPSFAHTIMTKEEARTCSDCHLNFGASNPAMDEFVDTGFMTIVTWDDTAEGPARLAPTTGIIPIPENYLDVFLFDFVDYIGDITTPVGQEDAADWVFLKNTIDGSNMLYATPLTDEQLQSLGLIE